VPQVPHDLFAGSRRRLDCAPPQRGRPQQRQRQRPSQEDASPAFSACSDDGASPSLEALSLGLGGAGAGAGAGMDAMFLECEIWGGSRAAGGGGGGSAGGAACGTIILHPDQRVRSRHAAERAELEAAAAAAGYCVHSERREQWLAAEANARRQRQAHVHGLGCEQFGRPFGAQWRGGGEQLLSPSVTWVVTPAGVVVEAVRPGAGLGAAAPQALGNALWQQQQQPQQSQQPQRQRAITPPPGSGADGGGAYDFEELDDSEADDDQEAIAMD